MFTGVIFLELAHMSGKRVRMVQRELIHIIYPMLFGLASVRSCARAVISCRSEWWSTISTNHSLAFSTLHLYREAPPPPLYPPPGSTPLDNASYYYYYYNNYYYLYLDLVDPGVLSIHKSNLIQFAKKKNVKNISTKFICYWNWY